MRDLTGELLLVDNLLSKYLRIHNDIFKFSLRKSIPIRGIFKATDYANHFEELSSLAEVP